MRPIHIIFTSFLLCLLGACTFQISSKQLQKHIRDTDKEFNKVEKEFHRSGQQITSIKALLDAYPADNKAAISEYTRQMPTLVQHRIEINQLKSKLTGNGHAMQALIGKDKKVTSDSAKWPELQRLKSQRGELLATLNSQLDDYKDGFEALVDALEDKGVVQITKKYVAKNRKRIAKTQKTIAKESSSQFKQARSYVNDQAISESDRNDLKGRISSLERLLAQAGQLLGRIDRELKLLESQFKGETSRFLVPGMKEYKFINDMKSLKHELRGIDSKMRDELSAMQTLIKTVKNNKAKSEEA